MEGEPLKEIPVENDEDQTIVIDTTEQPVRFCQHDHGVIAWFSIKKPSHLAGQTKGVFIEGERAQQLLKSVGL